MINKDKIRSIKNASPIYEKIHHLLEDSLFQWPTISDDEKFIAQWEIKLRVDGDMSALALKDPAAKVSEEMNQREDYVAETYSSFNAVLCYRVAHYLLCDFKQLHQEEDPTIRDEFRYYLIKQARKISEESKEKTKIEIHPSAKIGERFILDHGFGTIIGETSEIGNDCCFLQQVVLGARQINKEEGKESKLIIDNKKKRHPTIEDRVTIAGNVRVWGDITIGHDSTIEAYSIVTESIPPYSIVHVTNQLQVIVHDKKQYEKRVSTLPIASNSLNTNIIKNPMKIYGVIPGKKGVDIIGCHLDKCIDIKLIDNNRIIDDNPVPIELDKNEIKYTIQKNVINLELTTHVDIMECSIYLCAKEYSCIVKDALAWKDYLKTIK